MQHKRQKQQKQHKQHLLKWFLWLLLTALIAPRPQAGELRIEVTGYRLDRLYFPVGEEAHIYEHARFVVFQGDDSIFTGRIEHAWRGVAVSAGTGKFFDTLAVDSLEAVIETAELDTGSTIVVGTDLIGLDMWTNSARGNRSYAREYRDGLAMIEDFHADVLDGLLTFRDLSPRPEGVSTISEPAPFMVAMIPNVGRQINFQGQLTTSLYYRFDRSRLAYSFVGDRLAMTNRFEADSLYDLPHERLFQYDPSRGRQLFEQMTYPPTSLALHSSHAALDGLAHYFADIVSRDRCGVELVDDPRAADVRLAFVPVSRTLPSVTIYSLFHQMVIDSAVDMAANEYLRRIAAELRYVEAPARLEDYYRHLRNAGRIMSEDLGVFPLFRPTLFLHSHKRLQSIQFDVDGRLDFSEAILVHLPEPPRERIE